jgi:hypothetical protein
LITVLSTYLLLCINSSSESDAARSSRQMEVQPALPFPIQPTLHTRNGLQQSFARCSTQSNFSGLRHGNRDGYFDFDFYLQADGRLQKHYRFLCLHLITRPSKIPSPTSPHVYDGAFQPKFYTQRSNIFYLFIIQVHQFGLYYQYTF